MRNIFAPVAAAVLLLGGAAVAGPPQYSQIASWSAPDAGWDYASVDAQARRLYVGRFGGVLMVDLSSGKLTPVLIGSRLVHGVAPLPNGDAAASNGEDNTVTIFDGASGSLRSTIRVGAGPDSITFEPRHGWVAVTDEDGEAVSLVDPRKGALVGTIKLGGSPEAVTADGRGRLYDNIDSRAEIAVLDAGKRAVVRRIKLPGCDHPTGIAYDAVRQLVVSACRNGVVSVVRAGDSRVATTLKVGAGPDTVMIDSKRGVAFVPSGLKGELNVIALDADGGAHVVQVVPTEVGTRTGAVDPVSGDVYLPAATLAPSHDPKQPHTLVPGTFKILVYAPG